MSVRMLGNSLSDPDSGKVIKATTHGSVTKGYGYYIKMDSTGYLSLAIPSGEVGIVGVALHDAASGAECEFCIEGVCSVYTSGGITAGHAVIADNSVGFLKTAGGAFSGNVGDPGNTHCGVAIETGVGAGLSLVYLHGYPTLSVA